MNFLICYDGSHVAKDALKLAINEAKVYNGKVYIIHSMKGARDIPRSEIEIAESNLNEVRAEVEGEKIPCEANLSIRGMAPGEDIVSCAKENNIDRIIIGVKRRSKTGKILFGSTAQYVILEAPCPVLTLK